MTGWRLTDGRDPTDSPDDFPRLEIDSKSQLRQELDRLRRMAPAIVSLQAPGRGGLQIGIGGPFGGLGWFSEPFSAARVKEVLADRPYCATRMAFAAEGDTLTFAPELLIPADIASDIALQVFEQGQLPTWVSWKEWDPVQNRWTTTPATNARSV